MDEVIAAPTGDRQAKGGAFHAQTRREADRIKAVVLLGKGWMPAEVAETSLLDEDTVRTYNG